MDEKPQRKKPKKVLAKKSPQRQKKEKDNLPLPTKTKKKSPMKIQKESEVPDDCVAPLIAKIPRKKKQISMLPDLQRKIMYSRIWKPKSPEKVRRPRKAMYRHS
jgi:hypothetical protein